MDKTYGIILTVVAGLFFLIGGLISLKTKDKEKLNRFSVSLAFVIMLNLIIVDLLPEIIGALIEGAVAIIEALAEALPTLLPKLITAIIDGVLKISENLAVISEGAFYALRSLSGEIVIPDKVTTIQNYAFRN